jgi:hypothetical protein
MITGIIDSSQKIITNGLVLHLDAAQRRSYPTSGTTWTDLSGSGNTGTLINSPVFNTNNGGNFYFNPTLQNYINCGSTANLTNIINVTATAWVYANSTSGSYLYRYYSITSNNGWTLNAGAGLIDSSKTVFTFAGREDPSQYLTIRSSTEFSINNWYNITGVKSANIWKIFVNGTLQGSATLGSGNVVFASNNVNIGGLAALGFGSYLGGTVASTAIYNRALSDAEVLQNYNATKSRFGL